MGVAGKMTHWLAGWLLSMLCLLMTARATRIYRDPELLRRIPQQTRGMIDRVVEEKLTGMKRALFEKPADDLAPSFGAELFSPLRQMHSRARRDVLGNSTNPVYGEWSSYGECDAKCGGGIQVRTRSCLQGNCTLIGPYMQARECGTLPCVTGTYVLTRVTPIGQFDVSSAKKVKLLRIVDEHFLCYVTSTQVVILKWDTANLAFNAHQTIPAENGVDLEILDAYQSTYLLVLEKASMVFEGFSSRIYLYDPWLGMFDTLSAVTFSVEEPTAATIFQVFGAPFVGFVNFRTKTDITVFDNSILICDSRTEVIACPLGSTISIKNVFYGRDDYRLCRLNASPLLSRLYTSFCTVSGAAEIVSRRCNNQRTCELTSSPTIFTQAYISCPTYLKYLRVAFRCEASSYAGTPVIYKWEAAGLIVVKTENLVTYGAMDLKSFSIHHNAFVAVANYINDAQSHHLDSEVYVYNLAENRFTSLQKLRTDGALDWEFFQIGSGLSTEYFLAVANHVKLLPTGVKKYDIDSVIYKWNWNVFVPFQCIKTFGALKWTAIAGDDGEFTLVINNKYGNTTFYSYDGWRFYETKVQPPAGSIIHDSDAIVFYRMNNDLTFLAKNRWALNSTKNFYTASYAKTFPQYELLEATVSSMQQLNRSVSNELLPAMASIQSIFNNATKDSFVYLDKDYNFTGVRRFSNIIVLTNWTTETAKINETILSPADDEAIRRLGLLGSRIAANATEISELQNNVAGALSKTADQTILCHFLLATAINVTTLVSNNVTVGGLINGFDITEMLQNALFIDEDAIITGHVLFNNDVEISANVVVEKGLDGVDPTMLVRVDSDDAIYGRKTFVSAHFINSEHQALQNLRVLSLVNGVDLADVITLKSDQNITGLISFSDPVLVARDMVISGTCNGLDISALVDDSVLLVGQDIYITSPKRFSALAVMSDLSLPDGVKVGVLDMSEFNSSILKRSSDEDIPSTVTFLANVTFKANLVVGGLLSGVSVDDVLRLSESAVITSPKTFVRGLHLEEELILDGRLNGVDIGDDVLDTHSDQTVLGNISFSSEVIVHGNLESTGLINGVNVTDAYKNTLRVNTAQTITGNKTIRVLQANRVKVGACSFDCDLFDTVKALHYATAKDGVTTRIQGTTTFRQSLTIDGNLTVDTTINNVSLSDDLVRQGVDQEIQGNKTFTSNINAQADVIAETGINDVQLDDLYVSAWRKSQNSTVYGRKTFAGDVWFQQNLHMDTHTINNVDLQVDLVLLGRSNQVVKGRKVFAATVFAQELTVYAATVQGLVDGQNIIALDADLLKNSGGQIISGNKVFQSNVTFFGDTTILGLINGVNITELDRVAIRVDKEQTITGRKIFKKPVNVTRNLDVYGLVDGVNLTVLQRAIQDLRQPKLFNGTTINGNLFVRGNITVDGLINTKNLSAIVDDTVMQRGEQVLNGNYDVNEVVVMGNVSVAGLVNGFHFAEEIVPADKGVHVPGKKIFTDGFRVRNLTVDGLLNNINMTTLVSQLAYKDRDNVFTGGVTFSSGVVLNQNLYVAELIDGVNITDLTQSTLMKHGDQEVFSLVSFAEAVFSGGLKVDFFNGQNLSSLSASAVYRCLGPNADIEGDKVFSSIEAHSTVHAVNVTTAGTISGVDLVSLDGNAVKKSGNYTIFGIKKILGNHSVTGDLQVEGTINGMALPGNLVTIAGDVSIPGQKLFVHDAIFESDLASATVNGVDLSEFAKRVVYLNTSASISGPVRFEQKIRINNSVVVGEINGVNISDLMQRSKSQSIVGNKTFTNVETWGNVTSWYDVNGYDLQALYEDTLISGRSNTVTGKKKIVGFVTIEGNLKAGLIDGVNITDLFKDDGDLSSVTDLENFNETLLRHKHAVLTLASSILNLRQRLDYFVAEQVLDISYVAKSFDVLSVNGTQWLVVGALRSNDGTPCTNSSVYVQQGNQTFVEHSKIVTSGVTGVRMSSIGKDLYILAASGVENGGCYPDLGSTEEVSFAFRLNATRRIFERDRRYSPSTNRAVGVDVYNFHDKIFLVHTSGGNRTNLDKCSAQRLNVINGTGLKQVASFLSCESVKTVLFDTNDNITIAATLGSDINGQKQVTIYHIRSDGSIYLAQEILTYSASDIHTMDLGKDGRFLVVANTYEASEEALEVSYDVPVSVYKLEITNNLWSFRLYQDLKVAASVKLTSFVIGIYHYLAVATYNQQVVVFQYLNALKFAQKLVVPVQGFNSIQDMRAWWHLDSLYLGLLISQSLDSTYPFNLRIAKAKLTSDVDGSTVANQILGPAT